MKTHPAAGTLLCGGPWPLTSLHFIIKVAVSYWHNMVPHICISSVVRPFYSPVSDVRPIYFVPLAFCLKCCWMCFFYCCDGFFCKARCCFFTAACTKLLTSLLMLDFKKKKEKCVFCLYSAETMQKLIKGRTVLSQSRVGCIQIWSHIIYTSWKFSTVLGLQTFPG